MEPTPTSPLIAVGERLVRHRTLVLLLVLLGAAALSAGIASLEVGFKVDGFFTSDDPELQRAMAHYGGQGFEPPDRLLLFAWPEADPLADEALQRVRAFAELARTHEVVRSVTTLADATVPGELSSRPEQVAASSTWRQLLVARSGDAVGGMIELRMRWHHEDLRRACDELRAQLAAAGKELHLCGLPYHTMVSRQLVKDDMARFLPIGTVVSAVLLFWLVPHVWLALLALAVVPLTLASTLGVMGFCGVEITMLTSTLPTLLLCMSVADGLHMVGRFLEERDLDGDPRRAAVRTFAAMLVPCLLTSLTTIVGFASLLRADLRDLGHLGAFAAVGMAFAFVYTVLLLPPAMSFVRSPAGARPADPARWLVDGARWLQRLRARWWIAAAGVLTVVGGWQARDLETEHRITADLWPDSDIMRQLSFYEERFVGVVPAEGIVEAPDGFTAAARAELSTYVERLEQVEGVSRTLSIADLYADGVSPLALAALAATDLLPAGMLGDRGRVARVLVFRPDLGTKAYQRFADAVAALGADLTTIRPRLAGLQMVGTAQVLSMTDDLRWSFLGSVFVIFVLVWLQFRRVRLATVAMLACLVPMVVVLGVMVAFGITLRPLTVISFCVALALMVDDTIHLTARFREERALGLDRDRAAQRALATAGRPVVITTLVLLVGFVTILGSGFKGTFTFGLLVDLSLLGALLSALVLLPALLRAVTRAPAAGSAAPRARSQVSSGPLP
ncbi:MAG: MMPL family transporter [Planctomycetes bacterium]|nr:MMPL family transporter [Planctomycetota bacterium]